MLQIATLIMFDKSDESIYQKPLLGNILFPLSSCFFLCFFP